MNNNENDFDITIPGIIVTIILMVLIFIAKEQNWIRNCPICWEGCWDKACELEAWK